ncbi:MAG TPA: sigma-54-dependent Fis family transcriptional regulator, partial [Acetobacteraceae bacterium]|nr:sigma-54-dependent Fis family transcriptional regulator [Acetobacteraceae bacterium]
MERPSTGFPLRGKEGAPSSPALACGGSIANAWMRCREEYHLDPDSAPQKEHIGAHALRRRIEELALFERIGAAEMQRLFGQIAPSRHVLVLTDSTGVVLNALSHPAHAAMLREVDLEPGFVWDERHEGTNGPGTCLHDRQPVVVHRDEHFFSRNRRMTCSAVPVWGANGVLAGVLDVSCLDSTDSRDSQLPMIALASMSARIIEHQHFISSFRNCTILRFHQRPELVGLHWDSLLAIDDQGRVQAADSSVPVQFGYRDHEQLIGRGIEELFDLPLDRFLEHAAARPSEILAVTHRGTPHGFASVCLSRPVSRPLRAGSPARREAPSARPALPAPLPLAAWNCQDPAMARNIWCLERVMDKDIHILLQGETGTGKDTFAKAIHRASARHDKPFIAVSCAAIPETLIESELFGYEPGAFTGARGGGRRGKVLTAHGGTLFLDEIGDMPLSIQARLLRVLEEKEVSPLGSDRTIAVDLRIISATHRDLPSLVSRGEFRMDLYYRLNGFTLHMPALRDRKDREELIRAIAAEENDGLGVEI